MDKLERIDARSVESPAVWQATTLGRETPRRVRLPDRVEWPTMFVVAGVYCPILAALWLVAAGVVPWWAVSPVLAWSVAWQASLQHEVIHGHPTPKAWVNRLIAGPPLLLWMPYDRYRDSHLAHHVDDRLTDPFDDPESWYVARAGWRCAPVPVRWFRMALNTFAGRLLMGPIWQAVRSVVEECDDLANGRRLRAVMIHAATAGLVILALQICGFPLWGYLLAVVWPATSLLAVRTFAEHRPHSDPAARSVIVEDRGPLGVLFLSNNLHALHHDRPGLPWYLLAKVFHDSRDQILARNGGYRFDSYLIVARQFLLTPRDHPVHPRHRQSRLNREDCASASATD